MRDPPDPPGKPPEDGAAKRPPPRPSGIPSVPRRTVPPPVSDDSAPTAIPRQDSQRVIQRDSQRAALPVPTRDSQRVFAASPPREPTPPRTARKTTPPRDALRTPERADPTPASTTKGDTHVGPMPTPGKTTPATGLPVSRDTQPQLVPAIRLDTVELELELDSDVDPLAEPPVAAPTLDPEARAVIAACETELATDPEPLRAARLHHEIACAYEDAGFFDKSGEHFEQAIEGAPEYVPAIRGARRSRLTSTQYERALELFDAEAKLTAAPRRKAMLLYQKARVVEDQLGEPTRAREIYTTALDLDPTNASLLKAIEQCDRRGPDNVQLIETLERTANAISDDARHRAALIVQRARLIERHGTATGPTPAELYETALKLDPHALGALDALKRIYRRDKQWRSLAVALEREARQTNDNPRRALALYRLARIHHERLGNHAEVVAALAKAAAATPNDPLVLEDLAREYEQDDQLLPLAEVLSTLIELAGDSRERVALLHRLAQTCEALDKPELAIARYQEALGLDPLCLPVLQGLGRLLAARNQWAALVDMHLAEASATDRSERAAAAHARVAEILESKLRDAAEAAKHHARALALVPGYPASFKALTRLYAQLDRPRDLVELLERAVDEARLPTLKIAYLMKIGSVWEDGLADPVQSLHAFRRILELDTANLVAIHAIQRVAERAERHKELVEALEREVELVDDKQIRIGLLHRAGVVLSEHLADPDAGLVRFRKALELDPSFVPALASVGRIYFATGRWADLLDVYRREVDAYLAEPPAGTGEPKPRTGDAVALLHKMGELCEQQLGDVAAAIGWYRRAVELDPGYRPALRALTRRLRERGEWEPLATVLTLEAKALVDPMARALAWYRIGQVHEDWLDNADEAIAAYLRALDDRPGYRPARTAVTRLYEEQRKWMPLVELLAQESGATDDVVHATSALLRQAEIYRDDLQDVALATPCFEAMADQEVGAITGLLALEPLYTGAGAWDKLATTFATLSHKLADPGARVAVLRELARVQAVRLTAPARRRIETYEAILSIDREDEAALVALEQIGRVMRDDRTLGRVYARLGEIAGTPALTAAFLTALGRALERLGDRHALDAYKAAVKQDAQTLTAIRGLARVADLRGDARAMAQAARLEAELTRKPEISARLYVRAGILRREQMNDLGAVEDFERALEVWPDDVQGAERIVQPLLETGQVVRLIDILSRTAKSAKSSERRTALWLEVGNLYARKFDDLGAAITAFRRALDAAPGNIAVLSRLAEVYDKNRQWGDAVASLEQLLTLTSDEKARGEAHLKLAAIFHEQLNKIDRATQCVEAVLRHDPKHTGALLRLADIQLRAGNEADAVKTTQRLVDLADKPEAKGAALVRVARIQRGRGDTAAADAALGEALGLEGPGGDAERELKQAIGKHGSWVGYAAGLANYIKRISDATDPDSRASLAAAYLELARTYSEGMKLPARAIEALEEATRFSDDERIVLELAQRLRAANRFEEALGALKRMTSREPIAIDAWRELAGVLEQAGRRDEAQRVAGVLELHGVRDVPVRPATPRPASAADNSLDASAVASIAVDAVHASPATMLLASIADVIGKLYAPSLERYGISSRDRLSVRSNSSTFEIATRIGKIFGAEFEIYEHPAPSPTVMIEAFEMPALVVSQELRRLPAAQQVFLLAYAIGPIAGRLHPALGLRTRDLETALLGTARGFVPGFGLRGMNVDEVDEAKKILHKAVSRRWRRSAELAAGELAANPPADFGRWHSAITQTAIRAALLVADDLTACVEALQLIVELPKGSRVRDTEAVRDLVRFWISNRVTSLRRSTGMVT